MGLGLIAIIIFSPMGTILSINWFSNRTWMSILSSPTLTTILYPIITTSSSSAPVQPASALLSPYPMQVFHSLSFKPVSESADVSTVNKWTRFKWTLERVGYIAVRKITPSGKRPKNSIGKLDTHLCLLTPLFCHNFSIKINSFHKKISNMRWYCHKAISLMSSITHSHQRKTFLLNKREDNFTNQTLPHKTPQRDLWLICLSVWRKVTMLWELRSCLQNTLKSRRMLVRTGHRKVGMPN